MNNCTAHPDFTILRPFDLKIFYWEHLGLIDNPEYLSKQNEKINVYYKHNIREGDNLILTKEEDIIGKNNILEKIILENF